jgi:hypothetical protein
MSRELIARFSSKRLTYNGISYSKRIDLPWDAVFQPPQPTLHERLTSKITISEWGHVTA